MKIDAFKISALAAGLLLLPACSTTEDVPDMSSSEEEMRLYSSTNTQTEEDNDETTTTSNQPVFLFWDFGDWLGQTPAPVTPYHVSKPDQSIDTYKRPNEPYNTGKLYPDGNRRVVATGYAPSSLTPDSNKGYELLSIPTSGIGTTDILTSITPIVASATLPFDRADGETLEFMHAQSKVTFYAKLAENMGKFIKDVRISLDPSLIATQVEWSREDFLYKPKSNNSHGYTVIQQGDGDYQITKENPLEIGWAYIVPEQTTLPVTIKVSRSEDVEFTNPKEIKFSATLPFTIERDENDSWDKGKEKNILYANEAYTFTIVFGEEGIELVGNKCPWENGGYIYVPIYPFGNPTEETYN